MMHMCMNTCKLTYVCYDAYVHEHMHHKSSRHMHAIIYMRINTFITSVQSICGMMHMCMNIRIKSVQSIPAIMRTFMNICIHFVQDTYAKTHIRLQVKG